MAYRAFPKLAFIASIISLARAIPSVTPSNNALDLAKKVVGPGLTVLDATFQGSASMAGFYTNGPQGIPDSIVLTSGDATHPEDSSGEGTKANEPGFDKCVSLSEAAGAAYDAAVLTIKARVEDGYLGIFTNFVFATDEYPEYVGTKYNDVFGIWVDGTQIAYDEKNAPITINSGFFSTGNVLQPPASGTTYLGSTALLTSGFATTPGEHTIEIAVCDISDYIRDSAVFLTLAGCTDGSSCKNGTSVVTSLPPKVPTATGISPTGGPGCPGQNGPYGYGNGTDSSSCYGPTGTVTVTPTKSVHPTPTKSNPPVYTGAAAAVTSTDGLLVGLGSVLVAMMALL